MNIKRIKLHILRNIWKLRGAKISYNSFIYRGNEISNPQKLFLGENSLLYKECTIHIGASGSFKMGDNSHIAPFGYLLIDNNELVIGDKVAIGPFCSFFCHSNNVDGDSDDYISNYLDLPIQIGNNVFIGAQSVILPGTIIMDNVVVAANSVVNGTLEKGCLYGGSPARKIKNI